MIASNLFLSIYIFFIYFFNFGTIAEKPDK
jgi:hypothetical protein